MTAGPLNRDQQRAQSAFTLVSAVAPDQTDAYGRLALKLPFLIRTAGLAQALNFIQDKGGTSPLLGHLASTVGQVTTGQALTSAQLLERSRTTHDPAEYLALTREVLRAASWYKRLASSVLGIEPGGDEP